MPGKKKTKLTLDLDPDFTDFREDRVFHDYRWRLKETDGEGNQIGRDYLPFDGAVSFNVVGFRVINDLGVFLDRTKTSDPMPIEKKNLDRSQFTQSGNQKLLITGDLQLQGWGKELIVFGESKPLAYFEFEVSEAEEQRGMVSVYEDTFYINWHLPKPLMLKLADQIKTHEIGQIELILNGAHGFYTQDGYDSLSIKLLKRGSEAHKSLRVPDELELPSVNGICEHIWLRFIDTVHKDDSEEREPDEQVVALKEIKQQIDSLTKTSSSVNRRMEWLVLLVGCLALAAFIGLIT
jgi:hypothetical protein